MTVSTETDGKVLFFARYLFIWISYKVNCSLQRRISIVFFFILPPHDLIICVKKWYQFVSFRIFLFFSRIARSIKKLALVAFFVGDWRNSFATNLHPGENYFHVFFLLFFFFCFFFFRTTRPFYKESLQFFQRSSRGVRTKRSSNFHRDPRNATGRHSSVPFVRDSKQLLDLCTVKYIMRRGMSCPGCVKRISLFARNHRASSPRFS